MSQSTGDEAARDLVETMIAGWNQHDAACYASIFADDAEFTNVFGITITGRAEIEASHAPIFKTMFKDSHLRMTELRTRTLRPDVVYGDLRWEMTGARDPHGNEWPARQGCMSFVATRAPDRWSVAVVHNMDLPPAEAVAAAKAAMAR
jgi:uncharacterized protein (TIGR02246 family)